MLFSIGVTILDDSAALQKQFSVGGLKPRTLDSELCVESSHGNGDVKINFYNRKHVYASGL